MENIPPSASSLVDAFPGIPSACSNNDETRERTSGKAFSPGSNRLAPLQGKKVFMHYEPGTSTNKRVEAVLKRLKADLVDFFSRDVNYVITNRSLGRPTVSPVRSPSQVSPDGLTLRSSTTFTSHSNHNGVVFERLKTPTLSAGKQTTPTVTRGRAMLMAVRNSAKTLNDSPRTASPSDSVPSSILRQLQPNNLPGSKASAQAVAPRLSLNNSILNRSSEVKTYPNDLLVRARQLGIKILTIDMVVKWIMNLPSDVQSYIESTQRADSDELYADIPEDPERDRICQVRQLKPPCIKIVDLKARVRPLYLDHTDYLPHLWNLLTRPLLKSRISVESTEFTPSNTTTGQNTPLCSGSIPAASLGCTPVHHPPSQPLGGGGGGGGNGTTVPSVLSRQNSRNKRKERLIKRSTKTGGHPLHRSTSVSSKVCDINRSKPVVDDEPSGYCECCSVNYTNLYEHLHCEDHQQFATNVENYRLLDDVLNKLPSIQSFLARERENTSRPSEKSSERKRHRSRYPSGSKALSRHRQSSVSNQPNDEPIPDQSPTPFCESPAPVQTEPLTILVCPPLLNIPEEYSPVDGNVAGAGPKQQLFSDDEDSNAEDSLAAVQAVDNSDLRTVTNAAAAAILSVSPGDQPVELPQSIAELNAAGCEPQEVVVNIPEQSEATIPESLETQQPNPVSIPTQQTNEHLLEVWRILCDDVFVSEQFMQRNNKTANSSPCSPSESPVLEQFHRVCQVCSRSHIPCTVPTAFRLQLHSLLGPRHVLDGLGCTGYASPLSFDDHDSVDSSSCDEAATATAALILSEQKPESYLNCSQKSPANTMDPSNGFYITPPLSPVFDQVDNRADAEVSASTLPCFLPDSPPASPVRVLIPTSRSRLSCTADTSPVLRLISTYKPAFLFPVSDKCPPQLVSTPVGSPHRYPLSCDISPEPLMIRDSCTTSPSSPRSDSGVHRSTSLWKLNSASFDLVLPSDSAESQVKSAKVKHKKCSVPRNSRSFARRRPKGQHNRTLSECNGLNQLPVVKRPKLSAKLSMHREQVSKIVSRATLPAHEITHSVPRLRSLLSAESMTPSRTQTPRLAAKVARESISLSVRALFSPSGMDRCFNSRHPLICAAHLSSMNRPSFCEPTPTTPPNRCVKTQYPHSVDMTNPTCSNRKRQKINSRTHGRALFPERITTCR